MANRSGLHFLDPDDFVTECRNLLVEVVASLPPGEAQELAGRLAIPTPEVSDEVHEGWLQSTQFQAIKLEVLFKGVGTNG